MGARRYMALSILFLIFSLIAFLVFTETVTVRFLYAESRRIDIDLMIFGITLYPDKKSGRKIKKRTTKPKLYTRITALRDYLGRSTVNLDSLSVFIPDEDPSEYAVRRGATFSLISCALAYFEEYSKFFRYGNITVSPSGNNKSSINLDLTVEISLAGFISATVGFLYRRLMQKEESEIKTLNVGWKNE